MQTNNIKVTLAYTALHCIASSIALQSIFSSYIYLLTDGSNAKVGYTAGVFGLASCFVAPICGYFADKHRRDVMLRVAGAVGILATVATMVGVMEGHYAFLCVCATLMGIYGGIQNPPMEALFADSIDPGQRSRIFTIKYALVQGACAIGPLCSVLMFYYLGNEWQLQQCQYVIICGLILMLLPCILCFLFDDEKAHLTLSPATKAVVRRAAQRRMSQSSTTDRNGMRWGRSSTIFLNKDDEGEWEEPEDPTTFIFNSSAASALTVPLLEDDQDDEQHTNKPPPTTNTRKVCLCCTPKPNSFCFHNYIPTIIVLSDVLFGLASGMSVRFFPLFFMETYGLSPMAVSGIYVLSPLVTGLASFCAQRASHKVGRVSTTIACKTVGIALLFLMCFLDWKHVTAWAVVPVYILRTALMNSTKPLTRSIIMDSVPKDTRAKWNSLESITTATWSGSAVLGGLLVDRYGFLLNNLVTASLQVVSTLPLFLVLGLVPCEHEGGAEKGQEGDEESSDGLLDASAGSMLGTSFTKMFFGAKKKKTKRDLERGECGDERIGQEEEEEDAEEVAWETQLREQLARLKVEEDPELDLPLENEQDLARLERFLKRGRSRAGTVEDIVEL